MHTSPTYGTFSLAAIPGWKKKVLNWLRPFDTFCFLDNQQYTLRPHMTECLIAAGCTESIGGSHIKEADAFFAKKQWLFGHLSYELKSTLHQLPTDKKDKIGFPPFFFFVPQVVLEVKASTLVIYASAPDEIFAQLVQQPDAVPHRPSTSLQTQAVLSKEQYKQKINALQQHILRGDCYEINFCHEFFARQAQLEPFAVFENLMAVSPNPFSAFYRLNDKFLLCASPERFLAKQGNRLLSQPIKGTIKRNLTSASRDEKLKETLRHSAKDRAENVMVVDLVRNDLTKVCTPTTVKVDELWGVYTFPQVHQLISTVSGELNENIPFSQILSAVFPMGSMTGAPKQRVMQLIDEYEPSARGLFSGSVGYKTPAGDFDWNVVIRSILYNQSRQYLSYQVGSGITFYSDAETEWEECMLKASAIKKVLTNA